jgi:hypothetical protein
LLLFKYPALKHILSAALLVSGAAILTCGQTPAKKQNNRPPELAPTVTIPANPPAVSASPSAASLGTYTYEFSQPHFLITHVLVEHDSAGHGRLLLERLGETTPIIEPLEVSAAALARITALWQALRFLDSETNYQSEKQFPHMGTVRLSMRSGSRFRNSEFNWTHNSDAAALVNEYRRLADQGTFIFDITVARENRPLDAPKLMDQLEIMLKGSGLSDPQQLVPLLRELKTDERIPLMARNHAARLLKKIEK